LMLRSTKKRSTTSLRKESSSSNSTGNRIERSWEGRIQATESSKPSRFIKIQRFCYVFITVAAVLCFALFRRSRNENWCETVRIARIGLDPSLKIQVPCEKMNALPDSYLSLPLENVKSAVVCFLTAGVPDGKGTHKEFTASDYVNGALALGASLNDHLTRKGTHKLLLIREGFTLPNEQLQSLESVGWIIGKAPKVEVEDRYIPGFARYKTLYTKISITGLSEYKCVLLLDADTLVIDNIDDLLSCRVFEENESESEKDSGNGDASISGAQSPYHVAGVLDYYRGKWYHFNTGSILYKPSVNEMNRIYALTKDKTFMRRFESDQIFTNTVYNDRTNTTLNQILLESDSTKSTLLKQQWGSVVPLDWKYNAQTHVEHQLPEFWNDRLPSVKIIHFTRKKGWQCPKPSSWDSNQNKGKEKMPTGEVPCNKIPECACFEGYRWYEYLEKAKEMIKTKNESATIRKNK